MNARLPRKNGRPRLGPALKAPHTYSREWLSMMFTWMAQKFEAMAASEEPRQGRTRTLLLRQAALARQHAGAIRTELVQRVVYVSRVTDKGYVFWLPGGDALCEPCPWGIADSRAKRYIETSNQDGAGLYPRPIRFDPPEAP